MTEKKNEQGSEPGRPSWAAGLDLSPEAQRVEDPMLERMIVRQAPYPERTAILRRLADAEMRVAELESEIERLKRPCLTPSQVEAAYGPNVPGREPDFLIDRHGDCWFRMESGDYAMQGEGGVRTADYLRMQWGPVTEAWK